MKPYYQHGGITIYHGDCREILPQLPACDLVLTDPPYGVGEGKGNMKIPVISLWQPWGNWVALEWKSIETRTHKRFAGLVGKRIGIHLSLKWDDSALKAAEPYLSARQFTETLDFIRVGGAVICTVFVKEFRKLAEKDSHSALIDCGNTERYGLVLEDVRRIEAIPCKGKQGIWYVDISEVRG